MKRFLFIIAAAMLALSACSGNTANNMDPAGQTASNGSTTGQTTTGGNRTGTAANGTDKSDDNNDGKIDRNGDSGRTADDSLMGDVGNAVDDAANGIGNAAKDVVDGAEDMVGDMTGASGTSRGYNNNN